ncbi:MAG: sulfatase, partial [Acidobacteriota bacterium]
NHGVHGNNYNLAGGNGGWRGFREQGNEPENIGPWMQAAGYHTALIGKFLNGYPNIPGGFVSEEYIPLGWSEWYGSFTNDNPFSYFDFRLNENGVVNRYDDGTYLTDRETELAVDFLTRAAAFEEPFFLFLSPYAPHGPTEPAPRHDGVHSAAGVTTFVPPSFNESDMSDKPGYIQKDAELRPQHFPNGALRKLDMTLALDEMIQAVIDTLDASGDLANTYIFFVSDNGLLWGEHRLGGKAAPYEESIRVPMVVRGPTAPAGVTFKHLVANIDLAPTLLELAGAPLPAVVDGESFVRAFEAGVGPAAWRDALQIELLTGNPNGNQPVAIQPYSGIRTRRYCLVDHSTGDRELYDLDLDPFQLD